MVHTLRLGADFTKDSGFHLPHVFRVFKACPEIAQFLPCNFCSGIPPHLTGVPFRKMHFCGDALKVLGAVVRFVSVNVVDVIGRVKIVQPALSHNTVHKSLASQAQVPQGVIVRGVRLQLSKNFSAARNSVKMIVGSVFDPAHRKANHVGSPE